MPDIAPLPGYSSDRSAKTYAKIDSPLSPTTQVVECAVNPQAKAIVTFNTRDFLPEASRFGVAVVQPNVLVKRLNLVERLGL